MEQTLRRKVLLSWLILIFLQTAVSSTSMSMMSPSTTTRSEIQTAVSSTPMAMMSPSTTTPPEIQTAVSSTPMAMMSPSTTTRSEIPAAPSASPASISSSSSSRIFGQMDPTSAMGKDAVSSPMYFAHVPEQSATSSSLNMTVSRTTGPSAPPASISSSSSSRIFGQMDPTSAMGKDAVSSPMYFAHVPEQSATSSSLNMTVSRTTGSEIQTAASQSTVMHMMDVFSTTRSENLMPHATTSTEEKTTEPTTCKSIDTLFLNVSPFF
ncbi:putative protein TPRXL [Acropora millepora]|uniref:putative protein TPRXL n=1 Tax=Acropora millepora TaxID=45264 RepID=UPI001CF29F32|nr:putative protein TPRXL [Acropora millepora]